VVTGTAEQIAMRLRSFRMRTGQESDFQHDVATILARDGCVFEREYDLGPGRGRIDFYLPEIRTGLELKVKGTLADVARQLQRYATSREIEALVLVTGRTRLAAMPETLGGKPVHLVSIWSALL
jgi:hypothetical protein